MSQGGLEIGTLLWPLKKTKIRNFGDIIVSYLVLSVENLTNPESDGKKRALVFIYLCEQATTAWYPGYRRPRDQESCTRTGTVGHKSENGDTICFVFFNV